MPNQLAQSKKRKTVAEHAAVLALLEHIAASEGTTSTELLRKAAREVIRRHSENPHTQSDLRKVLRSYEPKLPQRTSAQKALTRFKRDSREFDELAIELGLDRTEDIQKRNSLHKESSAPVLIGSL
jgi:hypothetical protein